MINIGSKILVGIENRVLVIIGRILIVLKILEIFFIVYYIFIKILILNDIFFNEYNLLLFFG